ncbi:MAG: alpha-mannosidase [Candidatus Bipolaricaulia bacterium]
MSTDKTKAKRADDTEKRLEKLIIADRNELDDLKYFKTPDFLKPRDLDPANFQPCEVGFTWSRNRQYSPGERRKITGDLARGGKLQEQLSIGDSVWFHLNFQVPKSMKGLPVYLRFVVKPQKDPEGSPLSNRPAVEALCYRDDQPWQALDQGHRKLLLEEEAKPGTQYELKIEVGTTLYWGGLDVEEFRLEAAELLATRKKAQKLYHTFKVFNDLRKNLDETSVNRTKILRGLQEASLEVPVKPDSEEQLLKGVQLARKKLEPLKELKSDISDFTITTVGHAHIDAAWLWPWSETIRKCGRTFSSALKLMEEYPEFKFLQSQPHLYEFVRRHYPDLYDRISRAVSSNRWQPVGALWVESDVNLAGGETLTRQYLYGKRYFRKQFDVDPKITFIPDVFGYSPALPGIARAADCPYFFTQKMSWSEVNEFPHHSFQWEGIDGSKLLAHFPPADTYNGMSMGKAAEELTRSVKNYKEADVHNGSAYLIGWGDGGGGVNRGMLETTRTVNEIDALPDMEFSSLQNLFADLEGVRGQLEKWRGELYLERHRGTLTTQGETKKSNRELEFLLRKAELWSVAAAIEDPTVGYPQKDLELAWKGYLFHCFHDVLPGSSIREVYEDAARDYGEVKSRVLDILDSAKSELLPSRESSNYLSVFNSLSWEMDRIVETDNHQWDQDQRLQAVDRQGNKSPAQVSGDGQKLIFKANGLPAMGAKSFRVERAESSPSPRLDVRPDLIENEKIALQVDDDGSLSSIYDKVEDREVLQGPGNKLMAYRDVPTEFEAWELEGDIYDKSEALPSPENVEVLESGPLRAVVRQKRSFGESELVQDLIVYADSKRIDFRTGVDWKEEKVLLKTHFPINVRTERATYEVQYGHYDRPTHSNTSWDQARFEVFHQKWVDVSEFGYGAALLNDGKYGVNVEDSTIGLSLLRAPKSPDPKADMGEHRFTYSLIPHQGDFREAGVIQQAYDLNSEPMTRPVEEFNALEPPFQIEDQGVVAEAVKMAEDREDMLVIRFYEAWGRKTTTELKFNFKPREAVELNSIEDNQGKVNLSDRSVQLTFDPFEIKTVGVKLSK